MTTLLSAEGKNISKYLETKTADLYEKIADSRYSVDILRGEIIALKELLMEMNLKPKLKVELVPYKEMLD